MEKIKISSDKKEVSPEEAIDLWVKLKWGTRKDYSVKSVKKALYNTSFVFSARNENDNLIGLARVLSDGVFNTTVADIVVHPDYRGKGIGTKIMDKIKKLCKNTPIYLDGFKKNDEFFKWCGYVKRENMAVYSRKFK